MVRILGSENLSPRLLQREAAEALGEGASAFIAISGRRYSLVTW